MRDLVREVDRDGNGILSYRELAEFLRRKEPPSREPPADSSHTVVSALASCVPRRVASELRAKFDAAVASGRLDRFEDAFRGSDPRDSGLVSGRAFEDALSDIAVSSVLHACPSFISMQGWLCGYPRGLPRVFSVCAAGPCRL